MNRDKQLPWQQETVIRHSQRLIQSFHNWTGRCLLDASGSPEEIAKGLFEAPFVLVSHGVQSDPILNYGNRKALQLWELSWEEFTQMPSRKTAQEVVQEERVRLLAETASKGFSSYSGVRISSTGKRFFLENGIVWNVLDKQQQYYGQAATFSSARLIS
ncbi:MEKHLA domain-containing protein [Brasilonema octagenarum]|uniref:MEKHLA domain-containing protein n=1 Tax=Brasilonema octagenarum UFV-OR1 TaxID=417115 RepID=A0ABX1M250_9CYAN|nr:MEKHLA domain-containing protein [Brasilonema octagenarum]NMF61855.1 MEKHLA domain-containing protein [Brasilonema octagenarum UFV-OR1]